VNKPLREIDCPICKQSDTWDLDCLCKGAGTLWIKTVNPAQKQVLDYINYAATKTLAVPNISQLARMFELSYAQVSIALDDLDQLNKIQIGRAHV